MNAIEYSLDLILSNADADQMKLIDKALNEYGYSHNKWIPCSERLPEDVIEGEDYPFSIVTLDNGDVCLGVYRHDDKKWLTRMKFGETFYTFEHEVLAWMPLPEPYKGEK